MKKVIFILALTLGLMQANAQVDFGVKAGINFNSDTFKLTEEIEGFTTEDKMGYHAGIWTRFKLPVVGLYVRPELVYTALQSDVSLKGDFNSFDEKYNFQKLDLPILLGYKIAGVANVFVGPSFQYVLSNELTVETVKEVDTKDFTVGMQLGAGVEFGSLGVDVRWERGFSELESDVISTEGNVEKDIFDTRINQIIVGLSYKF